MKNIFLTFCFFGLILSLSSQETRTENNGNLVLEDIPAIPESIKENLLKFQNVRSAAFRGFNNKNKGLFISTRFGNVSQLHLVKNPGAARNQITYFQEPIGSVAMHPTKSSIAFTMDKGGTENAQYIYWILRRHLHKYSQMEYPEMEGLCGVMLVIR